MRFRKGNIKLFWCYAYVTHQHLRIREFSFFYSRKFIIFDFFFFFKVLIKYYDFVKTCCIKNWKILNSVHSNIWWTLKFKNELISSEKFSTLSFKLKSLNIKLKGNELRYFICFFFFLIFIYSPHLLFFYQV